MRVRMDEWLMFDGWMFIDWWTNSHISHWICPLSCIKHHMTMDNGTSTRTNTILVIHMDGSILHWYYNKNENPTSGRLRYAERRSSHPDVRSDSEQWIVMNFHDSFSPNTSYPITPDFYSPTISYCTTRTGMKTLLISKPEGDITVGSLCTPESTVGTRISGIHTGRTSVPSYGVARACCDDSVEALVKSISPGTTTESCFKYVGVSGISRVKGTNY